MPAPHRTFTRTELTAALADIDRRDLAESLYARRLDLSDGGGTALAYDYNDPGDLGLVLVTIATLLGFHGGDFAGAMRFGLPAHPDENHGARGAAYWPRWSLDELTWEQWTDEINYCHGCEAADYDRCLYHQHAPWEGGNPILVP